MNLPESIIEWIKDLTITTGSHAGEKFELLEWQRSAIYGIFGDEGISQAAISMGRGNGKTNFLAALASCALVPSGPLVNFKGVTTQRGEVVCVASSFEQSKMLFNATIGFMEPYIGASPKRWRVQDSLHKAEIQNRKFPYSKMRCISSDAKRAHGIISPVLLIADEVAQWEKSSSNKMRAALATSQGKMPNCKMVAIGTLPADRENWFFQMLQSGEIPGTYRQLHSVDEVDGD